MFIKIIQQYFITIMLHIVTKKRCTYRYFQLLVLALFFAGFNAISQIPTFNWARQFLGASQMGYNPINSTRFSFEVDETGNVYAFGHFTGSVDFDPGVGIHKLTAIGSMDGFICKLGPAGNFIWAKQIGGNNDNTIEKIDFDLSGNLVITGYFNGTTDFNPSQGSYNITAMGSSDVYICKLKQDGSFIWAKSIGGKYLDIVSALAVDKADNIILTGYFNQTADFDPGPGTTNLTAVNSSDIFICKLKSNGDFLWAKALSGNSNEESTGIDIDAIGNIYTAGKLRSTVDFDPGPAVFNLTSAGWEDIFISKLNDKGEFVWAKRIGNNVDDEVNDIVVDDAGNVYATGFFGVAVDFDPNVGIDNLISNGVFDIFIFKLTTNGSLVWAKSIGSNNDKDVGNSIDIDKEGNVYLTGYFTGTADFDPGDGVINLTTQRRYSDIFVCKLSSEGSYVWAMNIGDGNDDEGWKIKLDNVGNVFISGIFEGKVDFDPSSNITTLTANTMENTFILKLNDTKNIATVFGDINANLRNNVLTIYWSTISEVNSDYFEIQTSKDSINFKKVLEVPSKYPNGYSTNLTQYTASINRNNNGTILFALPILMLLSLISIGLKRGAEHNILIRTIIILVFIIYACQKHKITDSPPKPKPNENLYTRIAHIDTEQRILISRTIKASIQ